jgi:flagellar biosynthesis/type III secretory pathway chaperone
VNAAAEDLLQVLGDEEQLYQRLHELANRQRASVLGGATGTLLELVGAMEQLAVEHALLEDRRRSSVCALGGGLESGLSLRVIMPALEPDARRRAEELRRRLLESAVQLQLLNQKNAVLVKRALAHTQRRLRALQGRQPAPYTASGDLRRDDAGTRAWSA